MVKHLFCTLDSELEYVVLDFFEPTSCVGFDDDLFHCIFDAKVYLMILPSRFLRRFHFGEFYRRRLSIDGRVIRFGLLPRLECPSILQLEGFDFIYPSFVFRRHRDRDDVSKLRSNQERVISCFDRGSLFCRLFSRCFGARVHRSVAPLFDFGRRQFGDGVLSHRHLVVEF